VNKMDLLPRWRSGGLPKAKAAETVDAVLRRDRGGAEGQGRGPPGRLRLLRGHPAQGLQRPRTRAPAPKSPSPTAPSAQGRQALKTPSPDHPRGVSSAVERLVTPRGPAVRTRTAHAREDIGAGSRSKGRPAAPPWTRQGREALGTHELRVLTKGAEVRCNVLSPPSSRPL